MKIQKKYKKVVEERAEEIKAYRKGVLAGTTNMHPVIEKLGLKWNFDANKTDKSWYGDEAKFVTISPEEALTLLLFHNFPGNRNLNNSFAEHLTDSMEESIGGVYFAIADNGFPELVNGQHNLWAIAHREEPIRMLVVTVQCENHEIIGSVYTLFDSGRKRNLGDVIHAEQNVGELTFGPPERIQKLYAGIQYAQSNYRTGGFPLNTQKVKMLRLPDVQNFIKDFGRFMQECEEIQPIDKAIRHLPRGITAGMYSIWLSNRDDPRVAKFIKQYLSGAELSSGSPLILLRQNLLPKAQGGKRIKNIHSYHEAKRYVGLVYSAWKHFSEGSAITMLSPKKNIPDHDEWSFASKKSGLTFEAGMV